MQNNLWYCRSFQVKGLTTQNISVGEANDRKVRLIIVSLKKLWLPAGVYLHLFCRVNDDTFFGTDALPPSWTLKLTVRELGWTDFKGEVYDGLKIEKSFFFLSRWRPLYLSTFEFSLKKAWGGGRGGVNLSDISCSLSSITQQFRGQLHVTCRKNDHFFTY